jgi:hypothetical protein
VSEIIPRSEGGFSDPKCFQHPTDQVASVHQTAPSVVEWTTRSTKRSLVIVIAWSGQSPAHPKRLLNETPDPPTIRERTATGDIPWQRTAPYLTRPSLPQSDHISAVGGIDRYSRQSLSASFVLECSPISRSSRSLVSASSSFSSRIRDFIC